MTISQSKERLRSGIEQVALGRLSRRDFLTVFGASVLTMSGVFEALAQAEDAALVQAQARAEAASSFDYIIIGCGTSGSVLANRLSASGASVAVIEAGGDPRGFEGVDLPHKWTSLIASDLDWKFETVAQSAAAGRKISQPRGKAIGGSSAINALMYMRPSRGDLARWATPGWDYDSLLPSMQKVERTSGGARGSRGGEGPFSITTATGDHPLTVASVAAAQAAGYSYGDLNDDLDAGIGLLDLATRDGVREDAGRAYLFPALNRPNLAVLTETRALRLVMEGDRCKGVEVATTSGTRIIEATLETVLTAGAIGSPHLMMLSGIGAADKLRPLGIQTVADLPTLGKGLQDHMNIRHAHFTTVEKLAMPVGIGAEVQLLASRDAPDGERNIQLLFTQVPLGDAPFGFLEGWTTLVALMRPQSRGTISLASADPVAAPRIDPAYLSQPQDVVALRAGLDLARSLHAEAPLAGLGQPVPLPEGDIDSLIRMTAGGYYHLTGGCAMGESASAVCDPDLRVNGIDGLRVADASVVPEIPSVNTMATVLMIGERASELILS